MAIKVNDLVKFEGKVTSITRDEKGKATAYMVEREDGMSSLLPAQAVEPSNPEKKQEPMVLSDELLKMTKDVISGVFKVSPDVVNDLLSQIQDEKKQEDEVTYYVIATPEIKGIAEAKYFYRDPVMTSDGNSEYQLDSEYMTKDDLVMDDDFLWTDQQIKEYHLENFKKVLA